MRLEMLEKKLIIIHMIEIDTIKTARAYDKYIIRSGILDVKNH